MVVGCRAGYRVKVKALNQISTTFIVTNCMQVYGRYAFRLDRIVAVYIGKDIGPIFLNSLAAENMNLIPFCQFL